MFSAALRANLVWLTLIGVANSAIGAYYYLRIIVVMYMREGRKEVPVAPVPLTLSTALAISVLATLYLGLLPNRVLDVARHSAQDLLPQAPAASAAQIDRPAPDSVH